MWQFVQTLLPWSPPPPAQQKLSGHDVLDFYLQQAKFARLQQLEDEVPNKPKSKKQEWDPTLPYLYVPELPKVRNVLEEEEADLAQRNWLERSFIRFVRYLTPGQQQKRREMLERQREEDEIRMKIDRERQIRMHNQYFQQKYYENLVEQRQVHPHDDDDEPIQLPPELPQYMRFSGDGRFHTKAILLTSDVTPGARITETPLPYGNIKTKTEYFRFKDSVAETDDTRKQQREERKKDWEKFEALLEEERQRHTEKRQQRQWEEQERQEREEAERQRTQQLLQLQNEEEEEEQKKENEKEERSHRPKFFSARALASLASRSHST